MTALIHAHKLHAGTDAAKLFFKELMENVETLTGIADRYGPRTLAEIICRSFSFADSVRPSGECRYFSS